ncbi:MAG: diacylglycerol kinase family lipid kinase [Clostridiales bacterium]|nr:diacylglycerol kinase family lipid kinase [Clostridiales bacterium]
MDIIANKCSGKGNGEKCLNAVTKYLDEHEIAYTVHITERVGHGKQLAAELSENGSEVIVALGGDGTFHEVLNGIDFEKSRLGFIPAGRGNDFATGTNAVSLDPIKAIETIVRGEHRDLDYIQVGDKRCINVGGTGMDVDVLLKTANSHNKLTYVASLLRCLLRFKPYHVEAEINGETKAYDCIMLGVCNGTQFGGGIKLSPLSKADDGKMDVIIMTKPKHTPTLLVMPKFVKGKHMNKPYTHHIVCESIKVTTTAPIELDGEIYYDLDFDAHIVNGGLKTFAIGES